MAEQKWTYSPTKCQPTVPSGSPSHLQLYWAGCQTLPRLYLYTFTMIALPAEFGKYWWLCAGNHSPPATDLETLGLASQGHQLIDSGLVTEVFKTISEFQSSLHKDILCPKTVPLSRVSPCSLKVSFVGKACAH